MERKRKTKNNPNDRLHFSIATIGVKAHSVLQLELSWLQL